MRARKKEIRTNLAHVVMSTACSHRVIKPERLHGACDETPVSFQKKNIPYPLAKNQSGTAKHAVL